MRSQNLNNIMSHNRLKHVRRTNPSLMFDTQNDMRNYLQNSSNGIQSMYKTKGPFLPPMQNIKSQKKLDTDESRNSTIGKSQLTEFGAFK